MVSNAVLAIVSGLAVLPVAAQPSKAGPMQNAVRAFVERNAKLPSTMEKKAPEPYRMKPLTISSSNVCSVPLLNALSPVKPNQLKMPVITPRRHLDRMPKVKVPAPPCDVWPAK